MVELFKTKQLQQVIEVITSISKAERIYFLGASHSASSHENIFLRHPPQDVKVKEYQLLILLSESEKRGEDEVQNLIENAAKTITPITTIVVPVKVFNQWLLNGHLMAHKVYHTDCLIHASENAVIATPGHYNPDDLEKKVRREYEEWSSRAADFLYGVEGFRSREKYRAASFLLHQVAELSFMAAIRLVTGFRAGTHNLERMIRYAVPFCGEATNVFPRNSDAERKLFKKLQKAYIHARYKDDFDITEKELLIIIDRIQNLVIAVRHLGGLPVVR
jgi:HEPN domain-containing protein